MTLGDFRKRTIKFSDDLELIGEFSNNQDDIWKVSLSEKNFEGIYKEVGDHYPVTIEDAGILICLG